MQALQEAAHKQQAGLQGRLQRWMARLQPAMCPTAATRRPCSAAALLLLLLQRRTLGKGSLRDRGGRLQLPLLRKCRLLLAAGKLLGTLLQRRGLGSGSSGASVCVEESRGHIKGLRQRKVASQVDCQAAVPQARLACGEGIASREGEQPTRSPSLQSGEAG